jgi:uroporphyrinogen-III synthase
VRVLVTRTREQASELAAVLRELGAETVEAPAVRVERPRSQEPMRRAVSRLAGGRYDWLVLTSANGVRALAETLRTSRLDARAVGRTKVAAVGSGTAQALAEIGIRADLVPPTFTTEAVGRAFPRGGGRVLLMRADKVEEGLEEAVRAKGWRPDRVVAYRLAGATRMPAGVRRDVLEGRIDVLTFASGGTVRAFVRLLRGKPSRRTKVVCIGPVTARAARAAGLRVDAVAREHTIPGLAAAVVEAIGRG